MPVINRLKIYSCPRIDGYHQDYPIKGLMKLDGELIAFPTIFGTQEFIIDEGEVDVGDVIYEEDNFVVSILDAEETKTLFIVTITPKGGCEIELEEVTLTTPALQRGFLNLDTERYIEDWRRTK